MQYLFQISQQTVSNIIPEVCQEAILEEGKHKGKKLCTYFYTANSFAHKIDGLKHSNKNTG